MTSANAMPWLVYCEVRGGPLANEGYAGGFVTCVTIEPSIEKAIVAAKRALNEDGYDVHDIDKAFRFEPEEWTDDKEMQRLVSEAVASGELKYSDFDVWGH